MTTITRFERSDVPAILPAPRCPVSVRPATMQDVPFVDYLQKMHTHMVGWMPSKQLESYIAGEHVLIAEDAHQTPLGYCIARDQYMKRDDVGIVYQLNVLPLRQRHLVGAMLIKTTFDRAAYGCKLFCCWCAQDIQANWFWESIGFIPLAFRTGSRAKQRTHIFWQRRIREGDESTAYWFPSQTSGGAVAEDRIVLPIPPDTHWRDAKPLILPGLPARQQEDEIPKLLPGGAPVRPRPEQPKLSPAQRAAIMRMNSKHLGGVPAGKKAVLRGGRIKYIDRPDYVPELDAPEELMEPPKPKRPRKERQKNDPQYIAAARELRDRYLEEMNSGRLLPPAAHGKYDVSRQLESAPTQLATTKLLDAA
jgi:GNAT superfamily N-acetyltransferase